MQLPAVSIEDAIGEIVQAYIHHRVMLRNPLGEALHLAGIEVKFRDVSSEDDSQLSVRPDRYGKQWRKRTRNGYNLIGDSLALADTTYISRALRGQNIMARSDLLIKLVKAGVSGDQVLFRRTVEAVIAEEQAKQHHVLAERLAEQLKSNGLTLSRAVPSARDQAQDLLYEFTPRRRLEDLVLSEDISIACQELIEEQQRGDLLRSYALEPRHRVLLAGPPGNGKTALAESLAEALMVPLLVLRYEGVIGSYLGETAMRLQRVLDYVRTRHCVLFLDEFDTLGKERGDVHETGEIKRVVSSLLLQIDQLPSYVVIVTATNHPELLDRAVWRRFQVRLHLPMPGKVELHEWFRRFEQSLDHSIGMDLHTIADKLEGLSFAEVEEFANDILRRKLLRGPEADLQNIVNERLDQWASRFQMPV